MTEYTTSSDAVREFLTARERTALWVQRLTSGEVGMLASPSCAPIIIDDSDAPSYGPTDSEDESDHSTPPRMVLRWNDGRPDMPISTDHQRARVRAHSTPVRDGSAGYGSRYPSTMHPSFQHGRGAGGVHVPQTPSQRSRHAQTLSYVSAPMGGPAGQAGIPAPPSPEEIVILPSPQGEEPPKMAGSSRSHHSLALSRAPTAQPEHIIPTGIAPSHQSSQPGSIHSPSPRRAINPSHLSRDTHSPPLAHSHSQPTGNARMHDMASRPGTQLPYAYAPPQIVYAPSSRNPGNRYAPPAIVYSPPSRTLTRSHGPAPITYSHSDPLPQTHTHHRTQSAAPPYMGHRGVLVEENSSGSDTPAPQSRTRHMSTRGRNHGPRGPVSRSPSRSRSETPPLSEAGSRTSRSTYYVLPTPGQKVQIIQPGAPSLQTATTSTKASQSHHHSSSGHKNIFQRIFSIPKFAASVDSRASSRSRSTSGRKLQRRHTLGGAHLQQHT